MERAKLMYYRTTGNCLFRALSDQIYGHQDQYREIRATVVEYMRDHPHDFKSFVAVEGNERRNRKRKAASVCASFDNTAISDLARDLAWDAYLNNMATNGVYGDNSKEFPSR